MDYELKIFTAITADDYSDSIEAAYPCRYSFEDGVHRLKYTDDEAGFTVIRISPEGTIEIRRRGSFTIILQKDFVHSVDCETPYGSIPMAFSLQSISHSLCEDGGMLTYTARVEIGGQPQQNQVTMLLIPEERNDYTHD